MKKWLLPILLIPILLIGCSDEKNKKSVPKDLVEVHGAVVLEVSLLGEHKHITIRTIDEKVININVKWEYMPTLTVGKQIVSISYTKKDQALYSIIKQ